MLDHVVQMQHTVALDHLVGIVERHRADVATEEAHAFAQGDRDKNHRDLVEQAGRERLPTEGAGGWSDATSPMHLP